jgi:CHAT domain-containing protein/Flp pilus assembly protein TadD
LERGDRLKSGIMNKQNWLKLLILLCIFLPPNVGPTFSQTADGAKKLLKEGKDLYKNQKYKEALEKCKEGLNISRSLKDIEVENSFLTLIALTHFKMNNFNKALAYFQDSLKIEQKLGNERGISADLSGIGGAYRHLGEYQKALTSFQEALKIYHALGDKYNTGSTLSCIGIVYFHQNEYQKALNSYQEALKINQELGDKRGEASDLSNIGFVYHYLEDYQKAIFYYRASLILRHELADKRGEASDLGNIGLVYNYLGDHKKALEFGQEALKIHQELGDKRGEASDLSNLSLVYAKLSEYQKAHKFNQEALKIHRELGDKRGEVSDLCNTGLIYSDLGEYKKALKYHQDALSISQELCDKRGEAGCLGNIGLVYLNSGEHKKALKFHQDALKIYQELEDRHGEGTALCNIGIGYGELGDRKKALVYFMNALEIQTKLGDKYGEVYDLTNIGYLYTKLGDYRLALKFYNNALKMATEIENIDILADCLKETALVYAKLQQKDNAIECLTKSIKTIESIREKLMVEEFKIGFMQNKMSAYEALISLLIEKRRNKEAWSYLERSKARTCLDLLGNRRIDFREKAAPELIQKEKELDGRILELQAHLNKESDIGKRKIISSHIEPLQKEYEEVIEKMKLACPEYASLRIVQVSTLKDIQDRLDKDALILEYFIGDEKSYLFLIDKDNLRVVNIPQTEKSIKEMITALERRMQTKAPCEEQIRALSEALIKPAWEEVKNKKKLIVIPHSALYYLPFNILSDEDGKCLVTNHQILTLPSASVWKLCLDKPVNKGEKLSAYAIGNYNVAYLDRKNDDISLLSTQNLTRDETGPLPATKDEVESIAALYPGGITLIGDKMTSAEVKETIKQGNLVHFATHGILDIKHPLFSGLMLSDKILTTAEIFSLETNARIVVLSACNTAGGELSQGDELVGISRAFMYAGAPVVVASLWKVSDNSTAKLMSYFYENLKKGEPAGEAMRNAQLRLMKAYPHPYYWAPFVVIGEERRL